MRVRTARTGDGAYVVGGCTAAGGLAEETDALGRYEPVRTPRHGLGAVADRGRIVTLEGGPQPGLRYSDVAEVLRVAP